WFRVSVKQLSAAGFRAPRPHGEITGAVESETKWSPRIRSKARDNPPSQRCSSMGDGRGSGNEDQRIFRENYSKSSTWSRSATTEPDSSWDGSSRQKTGSSQLDWDD